MFTKLQYFLDYKGNHNSEPRPKQLRPFCVKIKSGEIPVGGYPMRPYISEVQ